MKAPPTDQSIVLRGEKGITLDTKKVSLTRVREHLRPLAFPDEHERY